MESTKKEVFKYAAFRVHLPMITTSRPLLTSIQLIFAIWVPQAIDG